MQSIQKYSFCAYSSLNVFLSSNISLLDSFHGLDLQICLFPCGLIRRNKKHPLLTGIFFNNKKNKNKYVPLFYKSEPRPLWVLECALLGILLVADGVVEPVLLLLGQRLVQHGYVGLFVAILNTIDKLDICIVDGHKLHMF